MSVYCAVGSPETELSPEQLKDLLAQSLTKLGLRKRVIVVPPDMSRLHSRAGELTRYAWELYGERLQAVLPAVGTHNPMNSRQFERKFRRNHRGLFQGPHF